MLTDRFVSSDVLTAMTQWLIQLNSSKSLSACNFLDVELTDNELEGTYLELVKHMYVTLGNFRLRQSLAEMLEKLVVTIEHAKKVVKSGVFRVLLQVALEQPDDVINAALLQNFTLVGTRVTSLVCCKAEAFLLVPTTANVEEEQATVVDAKQRDVCELVVTLMLSGKSLVFVDAVRMMQLLIDNELCRSLLPTLPDLRGALEKVKTLVRLKSSKLLHDDYVKELCKAQYELLCPEIDAFERKNGSVIGLLSDKEVLRRNDGAGDYGLQLATTYKTRGNAFFCRGNYPTSCTFYRRGIAVLRAAQLEVETSLQSLSVNEVLTRCTIGASVQVCSPRGDKWQDAVVSDINENGMSSQVEVLYDADIHEDEWVAISRI
ncbi:unnamed protein product [Peronospora belbahrii]|uniref:COP9 signalosome complex subunit 4 n=1 Tax=Peronospora belbahrii TaxID=622444 RepID=A0AAU9LIA4_9STRA|nr:unnamed protein product [Peronospora belbahrii]